MRQIKQLSCLIALVALVTSAFADVKVRQRVTVEGQGMEQVVMIRGLRERRETKMTFSGEAAGMSDMMPSIATITQCDARRTLQVNDKKKLYISEPFDDGPAPAAVPGKPVKQPQTPTKQGGLVTITYTATDTGERKQMFGLTARHLKMIQTIESSADSCGGAQKTKIEIDGWYADFTADLNCSIDRPATPAPPTAPSRPSCRDRVVFKHTGTVKPGFLLDGTMRTFKPDGTVASTIRTETLELTRSPLEAGLFDVGSDYRLVTDTKELYSMPSVSDMMSAARNGQQSNSMPTTSARTAGKRVGLNAFSGADAGKVDQNAIRMSMSERLGSRGFSASPLPPSQGGDMDYFIGVEIVKAKQSKAAKIGGLFGKVTGNSDASKLGDSEVEIIVTLYQKDGRTVVDSQTSKQKLSGSPDEAAKSAIISALEQLMSKMK